MFAFYPVLPDTRGDFVLLTFCSRHFDLQQESSRLASLPIGKQMRSEYASFKNLIRLALEEIVLVP